MDVKSNYKFIDKVFLRTPFYSTEQYSLENMPLILKRQDFRNALWLASPEFYRVLEKQNFDWDKLGKKERFSLFKYYNRMSFRATPFGAFSAFSILNWDNCAQARLVEAGRSVLHLLPSRKWQMYSVNRFKNEQADFYIGANPTMIRIGNILSFVRSSLDETGKMRFLLNSIAAEKLNMLLVEMAGKGPVLQSEITNSISNMTGCNANDAADYLKFLLDEQFFLTEFDGQLIEGSNSNIFNIDNDWASFKNIPLADDLNLAKDSERLLYTEPVSKEEFQGSIFYGGLERPVQEGGLGTDLQPELVAVIELLSKIVIPYPTPALKNFSVAFKNKFESKKVGLLHALDPDCGISYDNLFDSSVPSGLLKDVSFPGKVPGNKSIDWTEVHRLFLRIWQRNSSRQPFSPLIIDDRDIARLDGVTMNVKLPPSLSILFSRSANKLILENNGGASATALIGRFNVFSPEVEALCLEIARAESEANPEVIFAEVHQLSDFHVDNINRRKPVYDHVIHINAYPGDTGQRPIRLDDLQLFLRGDELVLESISLRKRVIPRLPTAYNFHHNELAVFRMLCDLQYQGLQANLTFDLEKLFPGLEFYPRVEYRNTIISQARWRLNSKEISALVSGQTSIGKLHILRQERGIPPLVSYGLSDQQLIFDLSSDADALFFLDCLKEQKTAVVREYLEPDRSVTSGKNKLAGQFIALLKRNDEVYNGSVGESSMKRKGVPRTFLPGSSWMYFKIYCSEDSADKLLSLLIIKFIKNNRRRIKSWFFIRYYDPDHHIRLRIHTDPENYGNMLANITKMATRKPTQVFIRDVKQDNYEREIERYSEELIEAAEDCFYAGSELVLSWLPFKLGENSALGFDMSVFRLVYHMAQKFTAEASNLAAFFKQRSENFIVEFGDTKKFRLDLDRKYRELTKELAVTLESIDVGNYEDESGPVKSHFLETVRQMAHGSANWPEGKKMMLLADLIHMQINRLYTGMQRRHELLIYYCLYKYTASRLSRNFRS